MRLSLQTKTSLMFHNTTTRKISANQPPRKLRFMEKKQQKKHDNRRKTTKFELKRLKKKKRWVGFKKFHVKRIKVQWVTVNAALTTGWLTWLKITSPAQPKTELDSTCCYCTASCPPSTFHLGTSCLPCCCCCCLRRSQSLPLQKNPQHSACCCFLWLFISSGLLRFLSLNFIIYCVDVLHSYWTR